MHASSNRVAPASPERPQLLPRLNGRREPLRRLTERRGRRESGNAEGASVSDFSNEPELVYRPKDLEEDLKVEYVELGESVRHDYSTPDTGVVPLSRRRPMWHFLGLWTTFVVGFSYMALGFEIRAGGYSLLDTIGISFFGYFLYSVYALGGAYLGSRTGQTETLLTRSIFGTAGSGLVSFFVFLAPLGWVGYQAGLLAQIWNGFYGWSPVETISIVLGGVMIMNNLFGFSGISVFARYLVTPLLILWCAYMVLKGIIVDHAHIGGTPAAGGLPFWVATTAVIGFAMWGNEADVWRYGKPRVAWPIPTYLFSNLWLTLFVAAGWMMEQLAGTTNQAAIFRFTVHYSLFGVFVIAMIIASISQFAVNDGNYYETINAGQNILATWKKWRRLYTCLIAAGLGALSGWIVNYKFVNGWFIVAGFLAVTVPCATVIMVVDHFLLPRLFKISRPLEKVPSWRDAGVVNVPAVAALVCAIFFGITGTADWPGGWLEKTAPGGWGPVPVEAWVMAGVLYIIFVAASKALVKTESGLRSLLGFSDQAASSNVPGDAVVDLVSLSVGKKLVAASGSAGTDDR
jgi:purine-cytosine permease-like protein